MRTAGLAQETGVKMPVNKARARSAACFLLPPSRIEELRER